MPHILVCTDGSVYAQSVYDHAGWAAAKIGASVEVLYAIDHKRGHADSSDWSGNMGANEREDLLAQLADLDAQKSKILQARGRQVLADADSHLKEKGVAEVRQTLRNGGLIETVAEIEDRADLVVIGKRGEAADFETMHLGANLERVVRGSTKPVLVTSRAFKPITKCLIAYDSGPSARKALERAAEGKLLEGLDILLLRVGSDTDENHRSLEEAKGWLEAKGRTATTRLVPGEADEVIAKVVKEEGIDLMVVGAYGHSRIRHLIIGSTTTTLIRSCQIPLLMFR
ncbi:universal stress protein [Rhodospirillum sp. A1_3_36]|uniref:universal stress protein n=1 Tax=Rhodospirillum sp. A1_3_36 TaxID=3391666 RepID=UPI0039A64221